MVNLYFSKKDGNIYWIFADDSSYIEPVYEDECISHFDVWMIPEYGGIPELDSNCNTFKEAVEKLEMASV